VVLYVCVNDQYTHFFTHTHTHTYTLTHTQVGEYGIHDLVSGPQHIGCVYAVGVDSLHVINTRDEQEQVCVCVCVSVYVCV
jgi:hypothetical protein